MKTIEERVRDATRAAADTVAPGSQPPLRLPAAEASRGLTWLRRRRSWGAWAVPVAAAAAVVAVIIASLTVPGALIRHGGHDGAASAAAFTGLPPYYAALTGGMPSAQKRALIMATASGKVIATVEPPKPYGVFDYITGAADDRTFVVAAQRWWSIQPGSRGLPAERRDNSTPMTFFWLRIGPAGHPARLAPLRIPGTFHATQVGGIGLSPDARKLAMTLAPTSHGERRTVRVVTLATGASRQWRWPRGGWIGNFKPMGPPLTWAADNRTLAFQQWGGKNDSTTHVRVLDTAAPGDSLSAARVVTTFANKVGGRMVFGNTLITPDGSKVVAVTSTIRAHGGNSPAEVSEFAVRGGAYERVLNPRGVTLESVLWTARSGDRLIVSLGNNEGFGRFGVVTAGTVTPLPGRDLTFGNVAW